MASCEAGLAQLIRHAVPLLDADIFCSWDECMHNYFLSANFDMVQSLNDDISIILRILHVGEDGSGVGEREREREREIREVTKER